jgi:hypothetical protein
MVRRCWCRCGPFFILMCYQHILAGCEVNPGHADVVIVRPGHLAQTTVSSRPSKSETDASMKSYRQGTSRFVQVRMCNTRIDEPTINSIIFEDTDILCPRSLWLLCGSKVNDTVANAPRSCGRS